jgi:hypothetical protein
MIDPNGVVGELLEQGQQVTKAQASDLANRLKGQVVGGNVNQAAQSHQAPISQDMSSSVSEDELAAQRTKEMVNDFYSPSEPTATATVNPNADAEKLSDVRRQLQQMHRSTYYDPLFAYENKKRAN